ncbi:uncharacterized protein BCR38DRAFT_459320 [Pseudomassariella vexata]|uniref:Uncharacterized protein n=1 Tax=Pseudomassariella vexata TaxID=1141098 RepID=A0A1Y2DQA9_9PEZI|nr:uncharacterized protein BCR38DRAFT_459320 [Pseudomassariella vexata]ORY61440.1 hypothetical protein BCR38DRAFT_459320 [Pseudomassariella vexata]
MPDLNSIPASPNARSRRTSTYQASQAQTTRPAPPGPTSPSLNILPSNQFSFHQTTSSTSLPSPLLPTTLTPSVMPPPVALGQGGTGVDAGPGPIRHPRPLTAADLHQQLEQEQELLVNRLTRDLTLLRTAQNSSVVSNASSTSASASEPQSSFTDTHLISGPGFPIPTTSADRDRRHQRTSSSTSTRSISQAATAGSTPAPIPIGQSGNAASILEAARNPRGSMSMSRQNSTTSHRSASRSRNRSPRPGSYTQAHGFPPHLEHPTSSGYFPRSHPATSNPHSTAATPGAELSPGLLPATLRYEETVHYRQELETAKRENEALKRRVKELEKMVRDKRENDIMRDRNESVSTTASALSVSGAGGVGGGGTGIAGGRRDVGGGRLAGLERGFSSASVSGSIGVGVPDEELNVGESAASTGVGTQQNKQ